jgi:hypothetical protein
MEATPASPAPKAPAAKPGGSNKGLLVAMIVLATLLLLLLVALGIMSVCKSQSRTIKRYYRGEGVRLAARKRKVNLKSQDWSIGTFTRVLPGSVTVPLQGTNLITTHDLRNYVSRGDPIKVGPQIFTVSKDLSRPYTATDLPLDTANMWIDAKGMQHPAPGYLLGPAQSGVTVYTCDTCELPGNRWTGPRGGAIGYWDIKGNWHEGNCAGDCPYWYSPLYMGPKCQQQEGPSPATLAKVKSRGDDYEEEEHKYVEHHQPLPLPPLPLPSGAPLPAMPTQ